MAVLRDEIKAGIIVVGSMLVLGALIVIIGGSKFFAKYDTYYTKVSNAAGLEVGAQVRIGGVRSGRILDIKAPDKPGELVTIVIGVNEGTPIYKGTTAIISQIGFVGDIYLLLSVKSTEAGRIEPGSTIPSVEPVEFSELMAGLNDLEGSLDSLINNVDRIFNDETVGGIESLVKNANAALVNTSGSVQDMAEAIRETTEHVRAVVDDIEVFVREGGDVDVMLKQARADLEAAEGMIESFEASADKMGGAVDRQDRNLDEVMANLNDTMRDLQDLLQTLKLRPWSVIHQEEKKKGEK